MDNSISFLTFAKVKETSRKIILIMNTLIKVLKKGIKNRMVHIALLCLVGCCYVSSVYSQKVYVWQPKEQGVGRRAGYTNKDTVDVTVYDTRKFPAKAKIECSSREVVAEVAKVVRQAFGGATVRIVNVSDYKNPIANHITVRIGIGGYSAGFGTDAKMGVGAVGHQFSSSAFPVGKWTAVTSFYVRTYDRRGRGLVSNDKEVYKTVTKANSLGITTARRALNESWTDAIPALMVAIDNAILNK